MGLLLSLLIGAAAGYLGSRFFSGSGKGLLLNLIIGIVGGALGNWLFSHLGIGGNTLLWELVSATIGAVILLWLISLINKK